MPKGGPAQGCCCGWRWPRLAAGLEAPSRARHPPRAHTPGRPPFPPGARAALPAPSRPSRAHPLLRAGVPGERQRGSGKERRACPHTAPGSGRRRRRVRATPVLPRLPLAADRGDRSYCNTGIFNWCRFPLTANSRVDKMTPQWFMSAGH